MSDKTIWMVRAGKGAQFVDDFIENNFVGIGFQGAGEVSSPVDKPTIESRIRLAHPAHSKGKISVSASQVKRYFDEIEPGHAVITYDPGQRLYFVGEITSNVKNIAHDLFRSRDVKWTGQVSRDTLLQTTRNSLGAISTLFLVQGDAAVDVWKNVNAIGTEASEALPNVPVETEAEDLYESIESKANELLEDLIAKLDWEQMQQLVAEILNAMGFKTDVSPRGPDRGIDVFASPDGLGLIEPRIFVEVKHRLGTRMGADQIRTFLGGRQPGDRCLYVSTGGFSKEAKYEAERANVPLKLIDLPKLRELVFEHYESFSPSGIALLPLKRLLWPA